MSSQSSLPEHDEVENYTDEAGPNVGAGDFDIAISIPEVLEIKMVDASALSDYEIWFFASGSMLTFLTGFAVAWFQEQDSRAGRILLVAVTVFFVLFAGAFSMTIVKRRAIRRKSRLLKVKGQRIVGG
jgi:hypothetical protein